MSERSPLPQKGDIIKFPRDGGYSHFGIYIGGGMIIHRSGPQGGSSTAPTSTFSASGAKSEKAEIRKDKLRNVARGSQKAEIFNFLDRERRPYSADEIVDRAKGKLGEKGYNLLFQNCEHFVTWCRYGETISKQVERVAKAILPFLLVYHFLIMDPKQAVGSSMNPQ